MKLIWRVPLFSHRAPLTPLSPGAPPGTLVAPPDATPPRITVIAYRPDELVEAEIDDIESLGEYLAKWPVTWVNIDGLGDAKMIERIGEVFGMHLLALEDVFNTRHRPKLEEHDDHLFVITRMANLSDRFEHEQLSLLLGVNYVVTFQERSGDCLEPVRQRLRAKTGKFKTYGPDYLAYTIIDAVVDGYFPVLEDLGERLEEMEAEIALSPTRASLEKIQTAKHDVLALRRSILPQREFLAVLVREENDLVTERTRQYLRDAYDHVVRIVDLVESYREVSSGLSDLYMSSVSNRMNDVMKVLTIMASVFIPLTFIAGIYGMNFDPDASPWSMPELGWYWAYPVTLGCMLLVAVVMIVLFRRRGWLGSK
jgi:magnesium transporter